jgi:hypothetical protein
METNFKVGDRVFHLQHGWGEVTIIDTEESYPITVCFNNNEMYRFTKEGRVNSWEKTPTLSFTEYTLQGFTQERPIVLPEVGELCLMRDSDDEDWKAFMFKEYNSKYLFPFITKRGFAFKQMKRIKILD